MNHAQAGILNEIPGLARYLFFSLEPGIAPAATLKALAQEADGEAVVVGIGLNTIQYFDSGIKGMRYFPAQVSGGQAIPSTPYALCCWLRGDDRGELTHQSRRLVKLLQPAFKLQQSIDAFRYGPSLDLTGYEDGTENPTGEEALEIALVQDQGAGLDGASFLALQQWVHDLDEFESFPQEKRDHTIGRRLSDNEEIEQAPESAHVKRTAQEDFEPEAFVLRRSMPWADDTQLGLVFAAFGRSFDAFEALLNRMVGKDDGVVDALFTFTHPVTGSYFWCPPMAGERLDLSALKF